jgi:glycosyltransferase involved in cell wall biosynthesis
MTRVLFVNHTSIPAGAERVLLSVVTEFPGSAVFLFEDGPLHQQLSSRGVDVILAAGAKNLSHIRRDGNLFRAALPLVGSIASISNQIRKAAKRYDVLYANSQKAFVVTAPIAKFLKQPFVWHLHDILSAEHFGYAQIKLDVGLANLFADRVICVSKATQTAFVEAGGRVAKTSLLYNGIAVSSSRKKQEDKRIIRRRLGLPDGFLYGCFSRIARWKGQHIAIEALQFLPPNVKCVLVGSPQFNEDEYMARLAQRIKKLDLGDRVVCMGHRTDVPQIMRAVDVYCHPSVAAEPFSLALLEAMHESKPIVATRTGGVPEIIEPGKTGLLVSPNNAKEMAAAVEYLFTHPHEAAQLGKAAHSLVQKFYTDDIMKENVSEIINGLLHNREKGISS